MKLLSAIMGLAMAFSAKADLVTVWNRPTNGTNIQTSIYIPTNTVAKGVSVFLSPGTILLVGRGTTNATMYSSGGMPAVLPCFLGPATLTLSGANYISYVTLDINPIVSTPSFVPSTAVVIPNDSNGPVNIILESSTDLLNWTPALPGTYGTTSSNRFFRVRATR